MNNKENKRRREPPFSLRLSIEERKRLEHAAGDMPLGAYIKASVFKGNLTRVRRAYRTVEDTQAIAKALALLGQSRLSSNLNQIAHAANIGSLPLTPDVEQDLKEACETVLYIKSLLIDALGLVEETRQ